MNARAQFIKKNDIRRYLKKHYPELFVTTGFMAYLDIHIESVLKRAAASRRRGKANLDASTAVYACRYPFHVQNSMGGELFSVGRL